MSSFPSRDNIYQTVNTIEKSALNKSAHNNITNHENLSFHQRAELVNSKLMAHKESPKNTKAPAPPTPKKPISLDSLSHSIKSLESDRVIDSFKQSKISQESSFAEQHISNHNSSVHSNIQKVYSDNSDSQGVKPKMLLKKAKDGKDIDGPSLTSNSKHDLTDYSYHSFATKHKKDTVDVSQIVTEGEGLKLVPVKQPTTFSLQAPWLKQDDIQVTVTG